MVPVPPDPRPALEAAIAELQSHRPALGDALVDAARQSERIRAALAQLSTEQAEVVQLSFFDDRPHGEIERALGIPLGTVKSRLRLAMAKLRALLGETP